MTKIVRYRDLRAESLTRRQIEEMLVDGRLRRVRIGHYAFGPEDVAVETAVRAGATLTCEAALRRHDVWCLGDSEHWRRDPDRGPIATTPTRSVTTHRLRGTACDGVDDTLTALACSAQCLDRESLVCAVDSALNRRLVMRHQLASLSSSTTGAWALRHADRRSESGLETLTRTRLRSLGIRVHVQVPYPGVGRVDLVVGDRFVIELDGDRWHSSSADRNRDRRRDGLLIEQGLLVLHAGTPQVLDEWPTLERQVLAVVRRDEHRWSARRSREIGGLVHGSR